MNVDFDIDMPSSFGPRVEKATRVIRSRSRSLARKMATHTQPRTNIIMADVVFKRGLIKRAAITLYISVMIDNIVERERQSCDEMKTAESGSK